MILNDADLDHSTLELNLLLKDDDEENEERIKNFKIKFVSIPVFKKNIDLRAEQYFQLLKKIIMLSSNDSKKFIYRKIYEEIPNLIRKNILSNVYIEDNSDAYENYYLDHEMVVDKMFTYGNIIWYDSRNKIFFINKNLIKKYTERYKKRNIKNFKQIKRLLIHKLLCKTMRKVYQDKYMYENYDTQHLPELFNIANTNPLFKDCCFAYRQASSIHDKSYKKHMNRLKIACHNADILNHNFADYRYFRQMPYSLQIHCEPFSKKMDYCKKNKSFSKRKKVLEEMRSCDPCLFNTYFNIQNLNRAMLLMNSIDNIKKLKQKGLIGMLPRKEVLDKIENNKID